MSYEGVRTDLLVDEHFLDRETAARLSALTWTPRENNIDIAVRDLPQERETFQNIRTRLLATLSEFYGLETPLLVDFMSVAAIGKTKRMDRHGLHADAQTLDGQPNHTPWREYSALVYLNTSGPDYLGGTIRFPYVGQEFKPTAGLLVGFRADLIHAHEVEPVTSGTRKAIAAWFTTDPAHADQETLTTI